MTRRDYIDELYDLLVDLEAKVGGKQKLGDCTGYMDWPDRGVYVFFARDEYRENGDRLRITRVGTHAVSEGSSTTLWSRLRTHRGANSGTYEDGGNHRGSVFRKRVGEAVIEKEGFHDEYSEWGDGSSASRELRLEELEIERRVSEYLRTLPFLWIDVDDEPSVDSDRAYIERNMIGLLSNYQRESIDPRGDRWLGKHSRSEKICGSGLWNVNHVDEGYDPSFLDMLEQAIEKTGVV